ncbi:dynein axonemal assembly factor 5 [Phlebotomus argentipes]|uniref:dynein axonemal assembly factor 5 n=1 Tax=Phlebotomus argentipes TaxID=94469 RepID=UPI002892A7A1|nr:dynein axonemal assembly factor 5 [Phlebotomus argentipes]
MTESFLGDLRAKLEQFCTALTNPDRRVRQRALQGLLELCQSDEVNPENATDVFDYIYLHILKCYSDKYESCRTVAVSVVSEMLQKLPENEFYLSYVIPTIARRIGQKELVEESEELRLQLLEQTTGIVGKYSMRNPAFAGKDPLLKAYNEIVDILLKTLTDSYPSILRQSCVLIGELSVATQSFHYRAEVLTNPLLALLKHRHSPIRTAAVETLGIVALHITTNTDCIVKIIVELSRFLMDDSPNVRRECGRVGCRMLLDLRDRYGLFDRILPLVFGGLSDESPEVALEIAELWEKCGQKFYAENEKELMRIALVDSAGENYPEEWRRPTLGCRAIAQRGFKMINIILHEMEEWKEEVRLHATLLLTQTVLHAEKAILPHLSDIYPVLAKTCMDENRWVASEAVRVAKLMGSLVDYSDWSSRAMECLEKWPNLGYLKCFIAMFVGSGPEKWQDTAKIAQLLISLAMNLDYNFQNHLLMITEILVREYQVRGQEQAEIERSLYRTLVTILALSEEEAIQEKIEDALEALAQPSQGNVNVLHVKHLESVVSSIEDLDSTNSERAEPILCLYGLLAHCGFHIPAFSALQEAVETVMTLGSPEAKVKILCGVSTAMLKWRETIVTSLEGRVALLRGFLDTNIVPGLVWKAGFSAESIRAMCVTVVAAAARGADEECFVIIPEIADHLIALLDDNLVVIRKYALAALMASGPLPYEPLRLMAFGFLARFDDPSAEIRCAAAAALTTLKLKAGLEIGQADAWRKVVKEIFAKILIHLDDPDERLKAELLETAKSLGRDHLAEFHEVFGGIPESCAHANEVNDLRAAIEKLSLEKCA